MATAPKPKIKDQFDSTTTTLQDVGMISMGISIGISVLVLLEYTKAEDKKNIFIISGVALLLGAILAYAAMQKRKATRKKEQENLDRMIPKQ